MGSEAGPVAAQRRGREVRVTSTEERGDEVRGWGQMDPADPLGDRAFLLSLQDLEGSGGLRGGTGGDSAAAE